MKRLFKIGFFVFFLGLLFAPSVQSKAYDFTIEKYHVDMKVTKQNTYQITERINVHFAAARHGIYRDIPLLNNIERADGSKDRVMAKIEHITCSDDFSTSRETTDSIDYCRLRIGDEDELVSGDKEYTISYDYIMGNDVLEGNDELYFNVIGTGWQTSIENVTFTIEMPDAFEENNLGMSYGFYGSKLTSGLKYRLDGNTIHGILDPDITLSPGEGVNVRLLLEEGYFERVDSTPVMAFVSMAVGIFCAVLAFVLWFIYGRDDPVVETVEFYPPDGLNSLDLAFAYKGSTDSKDVVSLLVYLAQKGYLKIREEGKKKFVIEKVKEYNGFNDVERVFFQGLFSKGDTVTKSELQNSFYKTVNLARGMVDNRENRKKIFYANSINKGWILWLLTIISFALMMMVPIGDYLFSTLLGLGVGAGFGFVCCLAFMGLFDPGAKVVGKIFGFAIFAAIAAAGYLFFIHEAMIYANHWYMIALIVNILAGAASMFFCAYMSKRTPYGTDILGKIRGFRTFLDTADKDRLEAMVNDDPQYFYDILPYTYVLDLSDKWMKKFESIAVEPPDWYYGYNNSMFNMVMFHNFMNSTMVQATSSMTSTPSSSSGGGFSGGGSGGGGGGSW